MHEKIAHKLFNVTLALQILGVTGHQFFFWVQENFYGDPNFLKPISDALNSQVSATSFFVVLGMTGTGMSIFTLMTSGSQYVLGLNKAIFYYLLPIIPGLVYTAYEYYQYNHPTYFDNNLLDVVLGWLAISVFWIAYTLVFKRNKFSRR